MQNRIVIKTSRRWKFIPMVISIMNELNALFVSNIGLIQNHKEIIIF